MTNSVSPSRLAGLLGARSLRLIDARNTLDDPEAGKLAWRAGHIPGAVHLSLDPDLSGPAGERGGRHPLPEVPLMVETFEAAGISDDSDVVVYDDVTGMFAGRVWWMLRYLGHARVRVLDGGFNAWVAGGHEVVTAGHVPGRGTLTARPRADMLASREEVEGRQAGAGTVLMDARSAERFSGRVAQMDRIPGRIPGAVNRPYADNLTPDGSLRSAEELHELYSGLGDDVIAYCGSGVSATLDILAMEEAGLGLPRLYAGSFSDWISVPGAPVERDEDAT